LIHRILSITANAFAMQRPSTTSKHLRAPAADTAPEGVAEPMAARAEAMLPAELLQPGEVIILLIKPHPIYILLAPIRVFGIIALAATLLVLLSKRGYPVVWSPREIVLVALVLMLIRLVWQAFEWLSRVYVLTDQRIIRIRGVLTVSVFECQLTKLQQTDLILPLSQRLLGLGTLGFATAGTAAHEAFWVMVNKPLEVHQKVVETIRRYHRQ